MARRLEVEIVGDARSLNRALGSAERSTTGLANKTKHLGGVALGVAGAAGIGALIGTIHTGIKEYTESAKVTAQTNAVIKSTGGAANVTAKHVQELGDSLLRKTGIDDENIRSGANLLLTFTNIRNEAGKGNDVFDQTVKVATDMSVALGRDLPSTARILGKALNDPISQLGALGRVGVTFTKEQKELIKGWVEHGQIVKAQTFILDKLNTRFKGSAEAVGKTLPGQINIAKETFKNFAGELVAKTIPVLEQTIMWLRDHWPEISAAMTSFWASAKPVLTELIALVKTTVGLFQKNWPTIGPIVKNIANVYVANMKIMASITRVVNALLRGDWPSALKAAEAAGRQFIKLQLDIIRLALYPYKLAAQGAIAATQLLASWLNHKFVRPAVDAAISVFHSVDNAATGAVGAVRNAASWFAHKFASPAVGGVISAFNAVYSAVMAVVHAIETLINLLGKVKGAAGGIGGKIGGAIGKIPGLADGGTVTGSGLTMVGEHGPEILSLPVGASVTPLSAGGGRGPIYLITPDGKALAEFIFDGMRGQAQIYKQRTGRTAFA